MVAGRIVTCAPRRIIERVVSLLDAQEVMRVRLSGHIRVDGFGPFPIGVRNLRLRGVRGQAKRVVMALWIVLRDHPPPLIRVFRRQPMAVGI